jgi:hypothetical protein
MRRSLFDSRLRERVRSPFGTGEMKSRKMKLKPTEAAAIMVLVSRFDEGNGEEINGCLSV